METTDRFHHIIDVMVHPISKFLHHNLTSLDTSNLVFYFDSHLGNLSILLLLFYCQFSVSRLFLRLFDVHPGWGKSLEPRILPNGTAFRKLIASSSVIFLSCFFPSWASLKNTTLPLRSLMTLFLTVCAFFLPV